MDGTFRASPKLFMQIYTMHIRVHGNFTPALFAFMPAKDEASYVRLLTLIVASATASHLVFAPAGTVIHCDYEQAVIRAVRQKLNIEPTGCLFHFGQCMYRHAQHVGLAVSEVCLQIQICLQFNAMSIVKIPLWQFVINV